MHKGMQGLNGRMRPCESLQMFGTQMVKLETLFQVYEL